MYTSIREKLKSVNQELIDLEPILCFMEKTGIEFRDRKLAGPIGIATFYCVYLDIDKIIDSFDSMTIGYIILHEIGHYKRISKMGKEHILCMLSNDDFDIFSEHIIHEEIIADRYAGFAYNKLMNTTLPIEITQQLNIESNKIKYVNVTRQMFGIIENNEASYIKTLEGFIINQK
jgi:hypothetical protein